MTTAHEMTPALVATVTILSNDGFSFFVPARAYENRKKLYEHYPELKSMRLAKGDAVAIVTNSDTGEYHLGVGASLPVAMRRALSDVYYSFEDALLALEEAHPGQIKQEGIQLAWAMRVMQQQGFTPSRH